MQTIQPGMTKEAFLSVFATEVGAVEGSQDVILKISGPYLQFSVLD